MSDLRAAVEGLRPIRPFGHSEVYRDDVLALIPEGAVLVTEETLAAVMKHASIETWVLMGRPQGDPRVEYWNTFAAAILRHLREGT